MANPYLTQTQTHAHTHTHTHWAIDQEGSTRFPPRKTTDLLVNLVFVMIGNQN